MADCWNPAQYERFKKERSQPFFDLLAAVRARPGMRALDLGCGPGALTLQLHRRLGCVETIGVDSSEAMLAETKAHGAPGLSFRRGDLRDELPAGAWDLVFSNAALQWVGDHGAVLATWTKGLLPGGQIAVQVPANQSSVTHAVAREVAAQSPFKEALSGEARNVSVLSPESYAECLYRLGFNKPRVWVEVYPHELVSRDEALAWVKGTLLTDYERRLGGELFPAFLEAYRAELMRRLPDERPFFFPFKRLFFWGERA